MLHIIDGANRRFYIDFVDFVLCRLQNGWFCGILSDMKMKGFWVSLVVFALLAFCLQSCKKQTFFANNDAEILLSADKTSIVLNETVRITITGYNSDGSYLWDGTQIDLFVENGSLNTESVEIGDGRAEFFATGDKGIGQMKISARSGSAMAAPYPLIITVTQQ